jgi:hypothetical protein
MCSASGPKLVAERQRRGREHHGQHNQRQLHDAHHQVDLDQLAGKGLSQPEALTEARKARSALPAASASGAIESAQLTSAHAVKNPSERKITHIE